MCNRIVRSHFRNTSSANKAILNMLGAPSGRQNIKMGIINSQKKYIKIKIKILNNLKNTFFETETYQLRLGERQH